MPLDPAARITTDRTALAEFALSLADAAEPIASQWFRHPIDINLKSDKSPVTEADRAIESTLRESVLATYPEHGILGEEHGSERLDADIVWVIDPIDGTRSFITGYPLWGTLIATVIHGTPEIGVIAAHAMNERWVGKKGSTTTFNNTACSTRNCTSLANARLFTTSPYYFTSDERTAFETLLSKAHTTRFNGDCYNYGLLASGHIDLIVECRLEPFDYCALVPIVEGAGGVITDWNGAPLNLHSDGRVIAAATPELHTEAMRVMGL